MDETLKAASRREFSVRGVVVSEGEIRAGALQRIADGVELMAQQYAAIITARDYHKRRAEEREADVRRIARSNAALRGVITRMKRKGRR